MLSTLLTIFGSRDIITGAHKRYFELLKQLALRGHGVNLISPRQLEERNVKNITISENSHKFPIPRSIELLLRVFFHLNKIKSECKNSNVILIFGMNNVLAGILLKKVFCIPLIFAIRSDILKSRRIKIYNSGLKFGFIQTKFKTLLKFYLRVFSKLEKVIYNKVDTIVVQNEDDRQQLIERYNVNLGKLVIIPNNVNVDWMESKYNNANNSKYLKKLIFIGTLCERKGIMFLLKAFKKLIKEDKELYLNILGDGHQRIEIEKYIKKNKLTSNIKLYGYIKDPLKYLSESDLLIVPSLVDSFPNVILEAFYVGTPIIGSNVGGIKSILKYDTLLFKQKSEQSIYNKLSKLLNKDVYLEYKNKCETRKEKFIFDWAQKFEKLF